MVSIEDSHGLATRINELHGLASSRADAAVTQARLAIDAVFECGELLMKAKQKFKGEFCLWLEANIKFSDHTARNYMRVTNQYRKALSEGKLDYKDVKSLYIAAGIMPEPCSSESGNGGSDPFVSFWSMTGKLRNWLPRLPDKDKPRLREWWLEIGRECNWL